MAAKNYNDLVTVVVIMPDELITVEGIGKIPIVWRKTDIVTGGREQLVKKAVDLLEAKAIPEHMTLIMVGDIDQLPSAGGYAISAA